MRQSRRKVRSLIIEFLAQCMGNKWFDWQVTLTGHLSMTRMLVIQRPLNSLQIPSCCFQNHLTRCWFYSSVILSIQIVSLNFPYWRLGNSVNKIVGTQRTWEDRAKAALFLFLQKSGSHLMMEYFRQLSRIHETEAVIWILSEVVDVYGEFNQVLQSSNASTKNTFPWENLL